MPFARACFRSWCADVNAFREVAEACLAHVVKDVEGAYQRSDLFGAAAISDAKVVRLRHRGPKCRRDSAARMMDTARHLFLPG